MTENVENLILEHLKRFQVNFDQIRRDLAELRARQMETHSAVIALQRDRANDAETALNLRNEVDGVKNRLERVERRLDLID